MTTTLRNALKGSLLVAVLFGFSLLAATGAPAEDKDKLDLTKAVKVGTGKVMVIEFTDPDCPYCRKAEAYFQGQPQVTRYIFFLPLSSHPASKPKVQYILSSQDRAKAYLDVVSGKFDNSKLASITPEGVKLQKEHQEIAKANGVNATPTFLIYGRIIQGFDPKRLEPMLK